MEKSESGIEKEKNRAMEQSIGTSNSEKQSTLIDSATEDELMVAQILLELKVLMSLSLSVKKSNWRCTRRRSVLNAPPLSSRAPSLPSTSVQRTKDEIEAIRLEIKPQEKNGAGAGATTGSPQTPLAFSSNESEQNPRHSSKISSKKRTKEECTVMVEELTQRGSVLREELKKVKKHYNKLKAYNSHLKAMKLEMLNISPNKEMNLRTQLAQPSPITMVPHHQPSIVDPTAQNLHSALGPITAHFQQFSNGPGPVNHVGPSMIDLNISSQPLDAIRYEADQRARYAEARRRRMATIKAKRSA